MTIQLGGKLYHWTIFLELGHHDNYLGHGDLFTDIENT